MQKNKAQRNGVVSAPGTTSGSESHVDPGAIYGCGGPRPAKSSRGRYVLGRNRPGQNPA